MWMISIQNKKVKVLVDMIISVKCLIYIVKIIRNNCGIMKENVYVLI